MEFVTNELASAARSLVGIPFRHRGRTRSGLDCAGVVYLSRRIAYGIVVDFREYGRRPTSAFVMERISSYGTRIPLAACLPGDVAVLSFGSFATHLGILTDTGVVHAVPGRGVVESARSGVSIEATFRLPSRRWLS